MEYGVGEELWNIVWRLWEARLVGGEAGLWDQVCVRVGCADGVGRCEGVGLPLGSGGEGRGHGEVGKGLRSMPPFLPPHAPVEMGG